MERNEREGSSVTLQPPRGGSSQMENLEMAFPEARAQTTTMFRMIKLLWHLLLSFKSANAEPSHRLPHFARC